MNIDAWLAELKIPREAYRIVALLPLVYVAWADGKLHKRERSLIIDIARKQGLLEHGGDATLERWLSEPPSPTATAGVNLSPQNIPKMRPAFPAGPLDAALNSIQGRDATATLSFCAGQVAANNTNDNDATQRTMFPM